MSGYERVYAVDMTDLLYRWSAISRSMEICLQQSDGGNGMSLSVGPRLLTDIICFQLGLLNAIQNIGCLAAYPFSPYVSDGYGRKTAVALGAFIMCGATILQTASHSVGMFIGARLVLVLLSENRGLIIRSPQLHDWVRPHFRGFSRTGTRYRDSISFSARPGYFMLQRFMVCMHDHLSVPYGAHDSDDISGSWAV